MSTENPSLFRLLEQTGAKVLAYDVGRRIGPLERGPFLAFEAATLPYPSPMQRKACFALVQSADDDAHDPVIWFLRLDLDEQGLLVQAARDYLLSRLLESAQARSGGGNPEAFLQDNPYAFRPREDRMAVFHARLRADLGLPPSRFYRHALDYFRGTPGWDQWSFVGYQGIADVACRHDNEPLTAAIPRLPGEPLVALCHCLESGAPGAALIDALLGRLHDTLTTAPDDIALPAALIRGLSPAARSIGVRKALHEVLSAPAGRSIEVLVAIAGRAWEALGDDALLHAFLQRLAANDHGQAAFEHCLADLLSLPALADRVRAALRTPQLSPEVRAAFGAMKAERGPTIGE